LFQQERNEDFFLKKAEVAQKKSFSLSNRESDPWGPKLSHLLTWDGELAEKFITVVCVCG
jgi:hypothetical protein